MIKNPYWYTIFIRAFRKREREREKRERGEREEVILFLIVVLNQGVILIVLNEWKIDHQQSINYLIA